MIRTVITFLSCFWEGKEYKNNSPRNKITYNINYIDFLIITLIFFIFVWIIATVFIGFMNPIEHVDAIT